MRRLLLISALVVAFAGTAGAQTVTPVASQLLPCRAGAGPANSCGGLCAVGSTCVYVPASTACSCQVNELICQIGTAASNGFCGALPGTVGGDCHQRGTAYHCD